MSTAFTKLVVSIRQTCHDVGTELNNLTEREGSSSTSHCRLCKWRRCKCGQQNIKISREQPTTHPPQRIHHYARSPQIMLVVQTSFKTSQRLPPSLASHLKAGQRACSLDGDADRLIYYYLDDRNQFHMLDGGQNRRSGAAFIVEFVKKCRA